LLPLFTIGINLFVLAITRGFKRWSELPVGLRAVAAICWLLAIVSLALGSGMFYLFWSH